MSLFSLDGKGIKFNSAEEIAPFLAELHDDVTEIRLSGNTFGVEASVALAKALRNKQYLQNAQMADIFTGRLREEIPAALDALLPALRTCGALTTVNLCDNAFGPTAAAPLEEFFRTHTPLKHLHLQNNGMGPEAGARMARALAQNTAALETIICGRNRLENGSVPAWVECFNAHKTLKVVKMPQNGIRPEGIEKLMRDGLHNCPLLEVVDMQDNTFTERGSWALAAALPAWERLQELAVGDCLLGSKGGLALANQLERGSNKNIKILRLQYNEIETRGLKALKTAIDLGLPVLETLELNGNKFAEDDDSLEAILALFEQRELGKLDELDDLEEESDAEDEEDDQDEDEDEDDGNKAGGAAAQGEAQEVPALSSSALESPLDAAIEKNLAEVLSATHLSS